MYFSLCVLFVVAAAAAGVDAAKILGIFPSCYSQAILAEKLMVELASRGHEVTAVGPFASTTSLPNYRQVSTAKLVGQLKDFDLFQTQLDGPIGNVISVTEVGLLLTEFTFETPEVKSLLASNETFDLVLCEIFFNEAHMGIAHRFEAPLVLFSSLGPSEATYDLFGNPAPISYLPSIFSSFSDRMSLWQRLQNAFIVAFYRLYWRFFVLPKQNELLQRYLPGSPDLRDLIHGADLALFNSHFSTQFAAPVVPSVVEIGGFHVDPRPLPEELRQFLDDAEDGVVYMSMGSLLRGANFPAEKRDALLRVFSKLKQKVLWKWEDDQIPGRPPNVRISKWLPQQDVLAHPNVKVFVSHCGLLGTIESVYHGVPVIGIPVYGDQKMNMALTEAFGSGIGLTLSEITEEKMTFALNEILTDPKYAARAKLRSKLLRDQPVKPIELAMYWIEYVIRNKGARHLRVTGLELSWYQYYMLDAAGIILGVSIAGLSLVYVVLRKILSKSPSAKAPAKKIKMK